MPSGNLTESGHELSFSFSKAPASSRRRSRCSLSGRSLNCTRPCAKLRMVSGRRGKRRSRCCSLMRATCRFRGAGAAMASRRRRALRARNLCMLCQCCGCSCRRLARALRLLARRAAMPKGLSNDMRNGGLAPPSLCAGSKKKDTLRASGRRGNWSRNRGDFGFGCKRVYDGLIWVVTHLGSWQTMAYESCRDPLGTGMRGWIYLNVHVFAAPERAEHPTVSLMLAVGLETAESPTDDCEEHR